MPSANPPDEPDGAAPEPATPRRASAGRKGNDGAATPAKKSPSPGVAAGAAPRPRATPKKQEAPTLLADFLKGRPSPARVAADRHRRKSVDAVRAEMRQEMRQSAVRRVQPPGGVKDRVKAWQKSNSAAIATPAVDDAATEPDDAVVWRDDLESVTEEDRIRIRNRQKRRTAARAKQKSEGSAGARGDEDGSDDVQTKSPPKKRVVSDDNWVKNKARQSPPRKVSPRFTKAFNASASIPKIFGVQATQKPAVANRIKAWADKVPASDDSSARGHRSSKSQEWRSRDSDRDMSEASSQATPRHSTKAKAPGSDGIRVTPTRKKRLDDDGIRVNPVDSSGKRRARAAGGTVEEDASDHIEVIVEPDTPTKHPGSRRNGSGKPRARSYHAGTSRHLDTETWISDEGSALSATRTGSDVASSIAARSLADIPGEIPFGHSAFSELDLPLNGVARSRPKRPKMDRSSSLKTVPNVLKKVVSEGKKIIQDMNDSQKQPVANNPPSIEKWLNNTVDPFVDAPPKSTAAKRNSADKGVTEASRLSTTPSSQVTKDSRLSSPKTKSPSDDAPSTPLTDKDETPQGDLAKDGKTPSPSTLKRRKATRATSSPLKPAEKRPFLGILRDAFQGESAGHPRPPKSYPSYEQRKTDDNYDSLDESVLSGSELTVDESPSQAVDDQADAMDPNMLNMLGPRLRPPTKGHHELSTIMSEEGSSVGGSDVASDLSHSTVTQSTNLTKDSDLSRKQSRGPGLKRRLTKHSDLVSVLSLPDDSTVPNRIKSNRSRPSLRKARGVDTNVTVDDLLKEFAEDENLYLRELKTLVDGVIPVLLSHVVSGGNVTELFSPSKADGKADSLSKSVVSMGVALEKLQNAHRKAPASDLRRLAYWAHGVVPIYNSYLGAWRMGFQDLVVNLAPVAGKLDDEDSLIGALPRNGNGDVVNEDGERVDVAHLLKRPLLRVKQLVRLIQCMNSIIPSQDTGDLLRDFENLQEKARWRHKEETARLTDENAANTDTTRSRDLKTLEPTDSFVIDPTLQVNAKDIFSLDLAHSNGQRLECQVELVHRDNQKAPDVEGDVLVREVGDGRRSYLLFPPMAISSLSARTGEGDFDMVVMVRGVHGGKSWHELLTLTADSEDQILDWLDILPMNPVPPREPEPSVVGDPDDEATPRRRDVPFGAKNTASAARSPGNDAASPEPTPYQPQRSYRPLPNTPVSADAASKSWGKTSARGDYKRRSRDRDSGKLDEQVRHEPLDQRKQSDSNGPAYRDDGAPPPPAHGTKTSDSQPGATQSTSLQPPVALKSKGRGKRRTSSPLKHEYLLSDVSSVSEASLAEQSDPDSSDDEMDSVDLPETELGVSLKHEEAKPDTKRTALDKVEVEAPRHPPVETVLSGSDCSLTPSNSASQAGLHGHKTSADEQAVRYIAAITRWSERGMWKDISEAPCSILVTAGLIQAYALRTANDGNTVQPDERPLLALDLTPLVLIRQSTALDLEIRSTVQPQCRLSENHSGGNFRFRCHNAPECFNLYMSVHHARLNNQKFIELENEARFRGFGERQAPADNEGDGDGDSSSQRRSWFGRKNSYRGSVRAPSQDGLSNTPSSSLSASSFLKRLTGAGNTSFNIARSSVDRHSHMGSGGNSLYTSGSSSAGGTPPRSPSLSVGNSSSRNAAAGNPDHVRIRLHLLATTSKWEDYGNCSLQIRRPPPGWHQALRADHGLEKRITATAAAAKRESTGGGGKPPRVLLDAVLGSACFTPMGNRGVVCAIWEEVKGEAAPATGGTGGNIKRWCLQFASAAEANWVLRLLHQEVVRA